LEIFWLNKRLVNPWHGLTLNKAWLNVDITKTYDTLSKLELNSNLVKLGKTSTKLKFG
jgi:hypothetical protein